MQKVTPSQLTRYLAAKRTAGQVAEKFGITIAHARRLINGSGAEQLTPKPSGTVGRPENVYRLG